MTEPAVRITPNLVESSEDVIMQAGSEGNEVEISETAAEQGLENIDESVLQDEKPIDQSLAFLE